MIGRFYTPHYCVACKLLAPGLRRLAKQIGLELEVYKVDRHGFAHQIGGEKVIDVRQIPAFPALVIDRYVLIGTDILSDVRRIVREIQTKTQSP